jgi:Ni/Co efflux regulator RcnB
MNNLRSALLVAAMLAAVPAVAQSQGRGEWRGRGDAQATQSASPGEAARSYGDRRGFRGDPTPSRDYGQQQRFDGQGQYDRGSRADGDRDRFNGRRDVDRDSRFNGRRDYDRDGRFNGRRDDNRYDGRRFDNDGRFDRWNNGWRNDRRYDWRSYRNSNRNLFRGPRYVAPRGWSYGYRPFNRGYRLSPYLYGSGYWLADPYSYRLPPAYGPYRWVRYYNDVMLVDITSGIVADVIQSFFY